MRKVTFYIDDIEFFKIKHPYVKDTLDELERFKVIYTLIGNGNTLDRYELTDYDGNKIDINSLNGYQKGVVLSDCQSYFTGEPYVDNDNIPYGVIKIRDKYINEKEKPDMEVTYYMDKYIEKLKELNLM